MQSTLISSLVVQCGVDRQLRQVREGEERAFSPVASWIRDDVPTCFVCDRKCVLSTSLQSGLHMKMSEQTQTHIHLKLLPLTAGFLLENVV